MLIKHIRILCAMVFPAIMMGCIPVGMAGSGGQIVFDDLKYPASMSAYLYGPDNEILKENVELDLIKPFFFRKNSWNIFYTVVSMSDNSDVVEAMNKEIAKAGGDGMVNVEVSAEAGATNSIFILNLLPFWPTYSRITVKGDIVKYVK